MSNFDFSSSADREKDIILKEHEILLESQWT